MSSLAKTRIKNGHNCLFLAEAQSVWSTPKTVSASKMEIGNFQSVVVWKELHRNLPFCSPQLEAEMVLRALYGNGEPKKDETWGFCPLSALEVAYSWKNVINSCCKLLASSCGSESWQEFHTYGWGNEHPREAQRGRETQKKPVAGVGLSMDGHMTSLPLGQWYTKSSIRWLATSSK